MIRHLYLHVPFCRRRCSYCDFSIAVRRTVPGELYVEAVLAELNHRREKEGWHTDRLETLYLGGGTPSLLESGLVTRLTHQLIGAAAHGSRLTAHATSELTLETNPEDVTPKSAAAWISSGVTRVSLGAQSFHSDVLSWMHRPHTAERTAEAVRVLRDAGVRSLSVDLIFGLPVELSYDFRYDLDRVVELEPEHVSVYGLTVEPRTPVARWVDSGKATPGPEERYSVEFLLAHEMLTVAGYEHYEVSNYAKPGHRSRHNQAYWQGVPYVGLGPSAHSFNGRTRRWNIAPWVAYERAVRGGIDPVEGTETLTPEQQRLEAVYLGLRTSDGIPDDLPGVDPGVADQAVKQGWLVWENGRIRATAHGWLRLDALILSLTTSAVGG